MWVWHKQPQIEINCWSVVIQGARCRTTIWQDFVNVSTRISEFMYICGMNWSLKCCAWLVSFCFISLLFFRRMFFFSLELFNFYVEQIYLPKLAWFQSIQWNPNEKTNEQKNRPRMVYQHSNRRWQNKISNDCEWRAQLIIGGKWNWASKRPDRR